MQLSLTEEDYLKAIYQLAENDFETGIRTNDIAKRIEISAASVSDMLKKLSQKDMIHYVQYQGVRLTEAGKKYAIYIIRKHRLWETFLVEKLRFTWDEVHEVAEQLEHIDSQKLIQRLDQFLDYPNFDPHGEPIPNEKGEIVQQKRLLLSDAPLHENLKVIAVEENSPLFLKHLDKLNINIGTKIQVLDKIEYDQSIEITIDNQIVTMVSKNVAENIFVLKW
jgi:DtxR family transcriptional regulator, Mn-dependent transcriptional regulator